MLETHISNFTDVFLLESIIFLVIFTSILILLWDLDGINTKWGDLLIPLVVLSFVFLVVFTSAHVPNNAYADFNNDFDNVELENLDDGNLVFQIENYGSFSSISLINSSGELVENIEVNKGQRRIKLRTDSYNSVHTDSSKSYTIVLLNEKGGIVEENEINILFENTHFEYIKKKTQKLDGKKGKLLLIEILSILYEAKNITR